MKIKATFFFERFYRGAYISRFPWFAYNSLWISNSLKVFDSSKRRLFGMKPPPPRVNSCSLQHAIITMTTANLRSAFDKNIKKENSIKKSNVSVTQKLNSIGIRRIHEHPSCRFGFFLLLFILWFYNTVMENSGNSTCPGAAGGRRRYHKTSQAAVKNAVDARMVSADLRDWKMR